jgi:hypothetical protein
MKPMRKEKVEDSQFPAGHDVGICSACEDFAICKLRRKNGKPVFFCEEFKPAVSTSRRNAPTVSASNLAETDTAVEKPEACRSSYFGLCRTCKKLLTCTFTKPGGGTWHCPAYEEME